MYLTYIRASERVQRVLLHPGLKPEQSWTHRVCVHADERVQRVMLHPGLKVGLVIDTRSE